MCRCVALTFGKQTKIRDNLVSVNIRDRIVVSTSRCGRDNPGSNPGHCNWKKNVFFFVSLCCSSFIFMFK